MTGRINSKYDNRLRRAIGQSVDRVSDLESTMIIHLDNIQEDIVTNEESITTIQGDITTIQGDIVTIQGDIAAISSGPPTTDNFVDTTSDLTSYFTYYPKTTGGLGSGESLPAMTDVSPGKQIMYTLVTDGGGNFTLSGTMKHQGSVYTSSVFADAGDNMVLIAVDNSGTLEWHILSYSGVALS